MSKTGDPGSEKIGEGLIRSGAMTPEDVESVLKEQLAGIPGLFGVIAAQRGGL